jgi:membrane protease YdiL (CAAX protease family)
LTNIRRTDVFFFVWTILALAVLLPVTFWLKGSFPLFTVVWLVPPIVEVLVMRDTGRVGFISISTGQFIRTTALVLGLELLAVALVEPWSHTYQILLQKAVVVSSLDTTFAWLVRFPGFAGLAGMFFYSGAVTLFGEELFFRGWLLQLFQRRLSPLWSILLQAVLFTLPQAIASILLPPLQGILYAVVYSFAITGLIGGWAASRTHSIWPSLTAATLLNLILCIILI